MAPGRLILLGLLGLVVAEAAVFLAIAQALGTFLALFTLFVTSIFGLVVPGRMGRRMVRRLMDILSRWDFGFVETVPCRGPDHDRRQPSGRVLDLDRSPWHDIRDAHITDRRRGEDRKPRC